jgi:hypothetical protein
MPPRNEDVRPLIDALRNVKLKEQELEKSKPNSWTPLAYHLLFSVLFICTIAFSHWLFIPMAFAFGAVVRASGKENTYKDTQESLKKEREQLLSRINPQQVVNRINPQQVVYNPSINPNPPSLDVQDPPPGPVRKRLINGASSIR